MSDLDASARVNLTAWDYKEYENLRDSGYDYEELVGFIWSCLEDEPDNAPTNSTNTP